MVHYKKATLILNDGTIFTGKGLGVQKSFNGEVVFNTGLTGYPETMTDPSYRGQIITFTYPLIGNYGVPLKNFTKDLDEDFESSQIQCRGIIISNYSKEYSHYTSGQSLDEWMCKNNISGITDIDTRALTKHLRDNGTMPGKIIFDNEDLNFEDPNLKNLVEEVSTKEVIEYNKGLKRIVVIDCGVKNNIIRAFLARDITVIRVPYDYDFTKIKASGYLISNGPGDPKMCTPLIENTKNALSLNLPVLGICLGSQILGLASGANTYKLKYGHRGANQPVLETGTKRCYITSQNHGYAVDTSTLSEDWRIWFTNDNDGTNEGIFHISKPFFGSQFHPEASPGPDDTEFIFDMFLRATN